MQNLENANNILLLNYFYLFIQFIATIHWYLLHRVPYLHRWKISMQCFSLINDLFRLTFVIT